jgi:hypothetical protein
MRIHCLIEGGIEDVVLQRIFPEDEIVPVGRMGKDWIVQRLDSFQKLASSQMRFLALVDLDNDKRCMPEIVETVVKAPSRFFLFQVAVREVESWLMADRENFSGFLGVPKDKIPIQVEELGDPKKALINLARRSRYRRIRESIVPTGIASVGKGYTGTMREFIVKKWDCEAAAKNSKSLLRLLKRANSFRSEG